MVAELDRMMRGMAGITDELTELSLSRDYSGAVGGLMELGVLQYIKVDRARGRLHQCLIEQFGTSWLQLSNGNNHRQRKGARGIESPWLLIALPQGRHQAHRFIHSSVPHRMQAYISRGEPSSSSPH
jgi:hypothetical protein